MLGFIASDDDAIMEIIILEAFRDIFVGENGDILEDEEIA